MEHQSEQPDYREKILQLNQGVLFCFNEDSEKMPVGVINGFVFEDHQTMHFSSDFFPITEEAWNVFAAELHCHKKGEPFSFVLHGIASVNDADSYSISFTIMQTDYFELQQSKTHGSFEPLSLLIRPYKYVYQKSAEILQHTFKRKADEHALNEIPRNP